MKITPESNVSYLNLGSYSDGKIEELTLHVGSEIPRERSLFKNGDPNQAWVCTDIERILDAPDEKYLCVQYRCAVSDFEGWTILSWGASVDGEWRNGKSYKASYKEANREQFFSMRMDSFRNMLHLSWDVKVDTIQLAAYNDGQIMDIWISDEKVTDPGDEKRVRPDREGDYRSSNEGTYVDNINQEGKRYPQNIDLGPWGWTAGDNSLDQEQDIIDQISEGTYLVVEYEADKENVPNLQFTVVDERCENGTKQQQVTPTYIVNGQALFAYRDIQGFLSNYLIPHEVKNLQISAQDGDMSIKAIRIVEDDRPLEDEPIAVLTKSWGTYGTEISRWHSDYEVGDTVKATATFDKSAPGTIAFTIGGVWSTNGYADSQTIIRTGRPDNDHMDIQIGQMPDYKSHVKITNIKVEIPGKKNFNEYVSVEGKRGAGILASTMREAATAILSDDEINKGVHTAIVLEESSLSEEEKAQVTDLFGGQDSVRIAKVSDVRVYKETDGKRTQLSETDDPFCIKVPVPDNLRRSSYDFAVMRLHDGQWTFLEDLDGNTDTVTFASDKFSKFAIIYGEPGAFDELSGALRVFRSEWNGWETKFSDYNNKYQAGKSTKVTLTFDKEVAVYMDYHNPDWTRIPADGEEAVIGKTFTRTITPSDDSLTIGIANLNGNGTVKLLNVLVEQDQEKITQFTAAGQKFAASFSAYYEMFVKGNPVTVKLTFDKEVVGTIGYHKDGTAGEVVESGSGASKTLTKTFTPGDDAWNIWIADMNGNSSVNLLNIEITQNVSPIYAFEHCWGAEGDQYSGNIADFCSDYEPGDKVKITAVLDKSSQIKMNVDSGGSDKEVMATGVRVSLTAVSENGGFCIQAGDDSKLPLGLLDVIVEIVEKAPEEEGLFSFTKAWGGDPDNEYTSTFSQHMADGKEFKTNVKTILKLTFDETVGAKLQNYGGEGVIEEGNNKIVQFEITPTIDNFMIQVTSIPAKGKVNLKLVEVTQEEISGDFIYKYTKTWEGLPEEVRNKQMENIQQGKETTVKLTFNKAVKGEIRYNDPAGNYKAVGNDSPSTVVEEKITPCDNYFDVVLAEAEVPVYLLDIELSQESAPEKIVNEFTAAWAGYETTFTEYNSDFVLGHEATVVLTFDQEVDKAQIAYKTTTTDWETTQGAGKIVTLSMTPNQDYMNIQITDMHGQASIKLLSVEVKQDAVEGKHEFKQAWSGYETSFVDYNSSFMPNNKTTVVLTFDQDVKAQVGYHTSENSGWTSKEGEGKIISLDLDNPEPPDDYLNIQITDMKGHESISLLSVVVIQDISKEAAANFSLNDMIMSEDYVHMFTEPGTIILELSDYYDEYELGQGVEVEMNLFSDGNFFARVEDADFVTITDSNETPAEVPSSGEEPVKATDSDAEPAVATGSDAAPAKARTKAKGKTKAVNTESSAELAPADMPETATDSNAEAALATTSNGTPAVTIKPAGSTETSGTLVYENDEDGTMTVRWFGNPQSGAIAVTILEMDGTQVNIDTVDVEENANAVSVKAGAMSAAKKLSAEICPSQTSDSKDDEISMEQDPAKKEEDLTGLPDETLSEVPDMPDGKPEEPDEKTEDEARTEEDIQDSFAEPETAFVEETDYSERETED